MNDPVISTMSSVSKTVSSLTHNLEFQKAKQTAMLSLSIANKIRILQRAATAAASAPVGVVKASALASAGATVAILVTNSNNQLLQIVQQETYKQAILQLEEKICTMHPLSDVIKARQEVERLVKQLRAAQAMARQFRDAARAGTTDVLKIIRILNL